MLLFVKLLCLLLAEQYFICIFVTSNRQLRVVHTYHVVAYINEQDINKQA